MPKSKLLDAERLSLKQPASLLGGVSLATLHRWNSKGTRGRKLPFFRIGWRTYILRDELERFVAGMSDPATQPNRSDDFERRAAAANERCESLGL